MQRKRRLKNRLWVLMLCLSMIASPLVNTGMVASAETTTLYTQDFTDATDVGAVGLTSTNAPNYLSFQTDADAKYGQYAQFTNDNSKNRAAELAFGEIGNADIKQYILEFDAKITSSAGSNSILSVKASDFTYSGEGYNAGSGTGYLFNLDSGSSRSTEYTLNGSAKKVTIPNDEWCHYKLYVDETKGQVSTTITGSTSGTIADKEVTAYSSTDGKIIGLYMRPGKNGVFGVDNVVVRTADSNDEFGEAEVAVPATVSYDMKGHGDAITAETTIVGAKVTMPVAPRTEGFVFRGWCADEACTTAWDFDAAIAGDMTLYARWIEDPVGDGTGALYYQNFSAVTDASTVAGAVANKASMVWSIATDDQHGYYLSLVGTGDGDRYATVDLKDLNVSTVNKYTVEFDAAIKAGTKNPSTLVIKDTGFSEDTLEGYLLKLVNSSSDFHTYTVNGDSTKTVTIPDDEWCHWTLDVDKSAGTITVSIKGATTNVENVSVSINGNGNIAGFFDIGGRAGAKHFLDNIKVYVPIVAVTGVTLEPSTTTMKVGGTTILTATVAPSDATDKTITWSSDNENVATVANGVINAVAEGMVTITATASGKTATCAVTVEAAGDGSNSTVWTFGNTYLPIKPFSTGALEATEITGTDFTIAADKMHKDGYTCVAVRNSTNKENDNNTTGIGYWPKSYPEGEEYYLFVGANNKKGKATLTLPETVPVGKEIKVTFVNISATNDGSKVRQSNDITLTMGTRTIDVGSCDFTAWNTKSIVTVEPVSAITINLGEWGAIGISKIEICDPILAESVTLDKTAATLKAGETVTLEATVAPDETSDKAVTWSSSDPTIATVDANGTVTAMAAGTATITVSTIGGNAIVAKTATCTITVEETPVTQVTLNSSTATLEFGGKTTLTATCAPENATIKTVTWSSDNTNVAIVTADGVVTAITAGTATITATAKSGVAATCVVTVKPLELPEGVYLDENFDGYTVGDVVIKSGTSAVPNVVKGQLTYKAGSRSGGNNDNSIKVEADSAGGNKLKIVTNNYADKGRGVAFSFNYPKAIPTVAVLQEKGKILELSMDLTATAAVDVSGYGYVPAGTNGHVRLVMDGVNNKKYFIVTDAEGKLVDFTIEDLADTTTFTGMNFETNYTTTTIDNLKVEEKDVDLGLTTITVKCGETVLTDASVTIGNKTVTTDENGQAVFVLPNGTYSVSATKAGYELTEGGDDSATGSVTVNSAAASLELSLRAKAYTALPTTVTIAGGQTYVSAPAESATASTVAFTVAVIDQMGVTMDAADYTAVWSIVNAATGVADPNVTISNNGVVTVAKAYATECLAAEYTVRVTASANNADASNQYTLLVGNSDVHYANPLNAQSELIPSVKWGSSMSTTSKDGTYELSHGTDATGNGYLNIVGNQQKGDRGNRLDLESGIVKGATVTFDWMLDKQNDTGNGQLLFVAPDSWHTYLTLRWTKDKQIVAYTKNAAGEASTTQVEFTGMTTVEAPIETGLGELDKWYSITLDFDYLAHTVDLTVTQKDDPTKTFTKTDIPIEAEAKGIRSMVMHLSKVAKTDPADVVMGLDNIMVSYDKFGAGDAVSATNPSDVNVAKDEFADFEWPTTAIVGLGDGTTTTVPLGEWSATPAFDANTSAEYVWTADLQLGNLTNFFNLQSVSFVMNYTILSYPTYVYNPPTLDLEFGDALPALPTTVLATMSDGSTKNVTVGEWTAIREFNSAEEGIYVYGANIVPVENEYEIVESKLAVNENPEDPSAQRDDYVYDVYYRISYFENEDNYNAYTRSMEYLDRGVYAIATDEGVFVSWRLLVTEYGEDIAFNVYRNGELVNATPIDDKTNFVDADGKAGDTYVVGKIENNLFYKSDEVKANAQNYISIPMQKPEPQPDKDGNLATYSLNDAGTADVDGDGQYEMIVKWYPSDAFDSGNPGGPSAPTIFDVYEMDGTALWRLNLGLEMPSGAHFNQFMLYDLDEDGKAELFIKTSDGSVTYKPNAEGKFDMTDESTIVSYIGDKNVVPGTNVTANGHVANTTNEYVTVFNGMTGEEIDTIDYVNVTGNFTDWGKDDGGNRSARYNIAIAYLPADQSDANCTETIPAVLFNRGYYAKTTVAAYTLRNGEIKMEWNFTTDGMDSKYLEKGNHNMATGDMDKDGFDELVIGAMAIDHDGTVLWAKTGEDGQDYAGHADAIHLAAMNPNSDDLYVFTPQENTVATYNESLSNARTGSRHLANWFTKKDVGRGVAANITPNPGYEFWSAASGSGIYGFDGSIISTTKNVSMNWVLYWDGDLLNELGDSATGGFAVTKYNWNTEVSDTLAVLEGATNNGTKSNPGLTADLFGDWREEVVVRSADDSELRIYMTTYETDYMIYTLMHDPVYRNSVANQNTAYNQPSHVGIYLGEDKRDVVLNMGLDTANVVYTVEVEEEGTEIPAGPTEEPAGPTEEPAGPTEEPAGPTEEPAGPTEEPAGPTDEPAPANPEEDTDLTWDEIQDITSDKAEEIEKQEPGQEDEEKEPANINFTRVGKAKLPVSILHTIKGKNMTVAIQSGDGVALSITGKDLKNTDTSKLNDVDMTIDTGKKGIPEAVVAQKPAVMNRQVSVGGNEKFNVHVNLHTSLGTENAGKVANLYRYNAERGVLEFCSNFRITKTGQAMFAVPAGGDYLITITNGVVKESIIYTGGYAGSDYVVQPGDNLNKISRRFNTTIQKLMRNNPGLTNPDVILPGDVLNVD